MIRLPSPRNPAPGVLTRAEAAYLGLALGDALGATVEFMTPREIRAQYGVHDSIRGGGWLRLKAGKVTDDTTMSLALGHAIVAGKGTVDALACAQALDGWMRSKPVDIGNTVRRNLVEFRRTGTPCAPPSELDAGNGAAMRVLPVALATFGADDATVQAAVRAQAHVTHNNPDSDAATELVAFLVQGGLRGASRQAMYRRRIAPFLREHPQFAFRPKRRDNPSGWIVETMQAVLQALLDTANFEDCLIDVVNRGGDADTTGAIAGMLAGALYQPAALPARWLNALDPEIAKATRAQASALIDLACARSTNGESDGAPRHD
ncbi:ADP-ribosyl-[dinitrogen reductase] hydrolase [Rhodocyclus gracilis]|uniref:ADP-ribosyl-[dinitrogen reductase] hydrolase n=1 Tax=Rhodocyclus gracilis TaxID=2929842 RepID=UPI0030F425AE